MNDNTIPVEGMGTTEPARTPDHIVADVVRHYHEAVGHLAVAHTRITGLVTAGKLDHDDATALQDDLGDVRDDLYGGILYAVLEGFSPDSQWDQHWSDIDTPPAA